MTNHRINPVRIPKRKPKEIQTKLVHHQPISIRVALKGTHYDKKFAHGKLIEFFNQCRDIDSRRGLKRLRLARSIPLPFELPQLLELHGR